MPLRPADSVAAAAALLADPAVAVTLGVEKRQAVMVSMATPKRLQIEGSTTRCYVHSVTEDGRIRKFKETWTIEWLRGLPDGAVLYDIGANIGITTLLAVEDRSRHVRVVAVEPAPVNFASLVRNVALNQASDRIYPLAIGLGARTAVMPLKLTTLDAGGAMHAFGDILQVDAPGPRPVQGTHFCQCVRLDELVTWPGLPFPTHVKIDVDGGEWDVLTGGRGVFADPRCVAVQIEVAEPDPSEPRIANVIRFMAEAGLREVARIPRLASPRIEDCQFARI